MLLVILVASIILLSVFKSAKNINNNCDVLVNMTRTNTIPLSSSQVIIVKSLGDFRAEITACQQKGTAWQRVLTQPFPAVVGQNGVISALEKKEGDLKTPIGLYPLGDAFGTQPLAIKMDYKYITRDDKFVDDVSSGDYNTWISGRTAAKSYESMLIASYKMGLMIKYNMNPVIPGKGSAIFMHLWRSPDVPTNGCIAMDEHHLLTILHWLDKKQHPYVYIS